LDVYSGPGFTAGVTHAEFVEDVGAVETGVVAELTGDDFEGAGVGVDYELLFSFDCAGIFTEVFGDFHLIVSYVWCWGGGGSYFTGSSTGYNVVVFDGAFYDHDSIV